MSVQVTLEILRNGSNDPVALEVRNNLGLYLHLEARYQGELLNEQQLRSLGETIVSGARGVGAAVEWRGLLT